MFIGEAPGVREDRVGRPFLGRAGVFLDTLIEAVGINRRDIYITSSVKCRPPGNRKPRADELACCRTAWLENQIDIIRPRLLVLLGNTALQQVLGAGVRLRDVRGQLLSRDGSTVLPTYHPAAGMRFPELGKQMRRDFAKLAAGRAARAKTRAR
jgi:DNA polymerase